MASLSIWKRELKSSDFAPVAARLCLLPSSSFFPIPQCTALPYNDSGACVWSHCGWTWRSRYLGVHVESWKAGSHVQLVLSFVHSTCSKRVRVWSAAKSPGSLPTLAFSCASLNALCMVMAPAYRRLPLAGGKYFYRDDKKSDRSTHCGSEAEIREKRYTSHSLYVILPTGLW